MARKTGQPEKNNNDNHKKPKKGRVFLFRTKNGADEYLSSNDFFESDGEESTVNNNFFADDEQLSNSEIKSEKAVYNPRRFFTEDTNNVEEPSKTGASNENIDIEQDKASLFKEPAVQETEIKHEILEETAEVKQNLGPFSKRKKDADYIDGDTEDIEDDSGEFEDTETDKKAEKTKRGLGSIFFKDADPKQDRASNENQIDEEQAASEESEQQENNKNQPVKRKSHKSLLTHLGEVEFEETEIPDEVILAESGAQSFDAAETEDQPKKSRRGLFARFEEEPEINETMDEEHEDLEQIHVSKKRRLFANKKADYQQQETAEESGESVSGTEDGIGTEPVPEKRGLLSRFKDKPEEAEVADEENTEEVKDETTGKSRRLFSRSEKNRDEEEPAVQETEQDSRQPTRRKSHSNLLAHLEEVEFEETELPDEVILAEGGSDSAESLGAKPKKNMGLFARFEEEYALEETIAEDKEETDIESEQPPKKRRSLFAQKSADYLEEIIEDEQGKNDMETDIEQDAEMNKENEKQPDSQDTIEDNITKEASEEGKKGFINRLFHTEKHGDDIDNSEDEYEQLFTDEEETRYRRKHRGWFDRSEEDDLKEEPEAAQNGEADLDTVENEEHSSKKHGLFGRKKKDKIVEETKHSEESALKEEASANVDIQLEERRNNKRKNHKGLLSSLKNETVETKKAQNKDSQQDEFKPEKLDKSKEDETTLEQNNANVLEDTEERRAKRSNKAAVAGWNKKDRKADYAIKTLNKPDSFEKKQKRSAKKLSKKREGFFAGIFAFAKGLLPEKKGVKHALEFASSAKHRKAKTKRTLIITGTSVLAAAIVLAVIFIPFGDSPASSQTDDELVAAISDVANAGADVENTPEQGADIATTPEQIPTTVPTVESTPEVALTPIVTTQPDPTHRTINVESMVEEFMVEADLYYNKVGYSNNYYEYTENEIYMLAQLIHGEARGESLDGMVAVGNVVMNRVLNRRYFGNSIKAVITASGQFSGYKSTIVPSSKCKIAARKVLDFQVWVVPQNVYYFKAGGSVGVNWGSHKFYSRIGGHNFYTHRYGGRSNTDKVPPRMFERTYKWPRMGCIPDDRVYRVQFMLNKLGYDVKADSYFGEGTMEELKKYQEDKGLECDGVAGPTTVETLIRDFGLENFYDEFYT